MKTQRKREGRRNGNAMLTVLIVVVSVSGLLVLAVQNSVERTFMARRLADRVTAQVIADTGAQRAYVQLGGDFALRTNAAAFPETPYGGGTYDVSVKPVGEKGAVIESVGRYRGIVETVILDTTLYDAVDTNEVNAYGYAILAGRNISWTGCGVFQGGSRVHANGSFRQAGSGELNAFVTSSSGVDLNGNSGYIAGDVTAPEVTGKTNKITGVVTRAGVAAVPIPIIDLLPYYQEALASGQVFAGPKTISGNCAPTGGIMWVNGALTIGGNGIVRGCFIATGDIHYSGSGAHTKVAGYPAFVSRDGNIKFSGSGTWQGLVFARIGNVDVVGGGTLTGTIICGGDFTKAGVSTIMNYAKAIPVAPNETPTPGILCVSAWQQ